MENYKNIHKVILNRYDKAITLTRGSFNRSFLTLHNGKIIAVLTGAVGRAGKRSLIVRFRVSGQAQRFFGNDNLKLTTCFVNRVQTYHYCESGSLELVDLPEFSLSRE